MNEHQEFEASWWGDCTNTYTEETKQTVYARHMGLAATGDSGKWPVYDLEGRSVVDLGGGPVSMLLKTQNGSGIVVDPCPYPNWVAARYVAHGIVYQRAPAETFTSDRRFDECWIYNVLQHVDDPAAVIATAKAHAQTLRIFEWVGMEPHLGHPHKLMPALLDEWIGAATRGLVTRLNESGCIGDAYYGVFDL